MGSFPTLDPLELYSGIIAGPRRSPLPAEWLLDAEGSPRDVLENLLIEPLSDGPCHVAFSGGRDSSAMLAAATHVARRHGLPEPIPLTVRLAAHPRTWETDWQELTMRHLGLKDWEVISITDELDALGPAATAALRRHGHYWPSQGHSMAVFAAHCGSGSLLTGGGGDEVFAGWSQRRNALRTILALRPRRRAAKWLAFSALPFRLRIEILLRREPPIASPWLQPDISAEVQEQFRRRARRPTKNWGEVLEGFIASRYLECLRPVLDTMVADHGVRLHEPFYDPAFIRAIARAAPPEGYLSRTEGLEAHFSDLLPPEVLRRSTKAVFTEVAWGPRATEFARAWDGTGLDERYVIPERLQEEWTSGKPNPRSIPALHRAWLVGQAPAA
jgi:asparagine synthetase B (glutamine-hydrolysing)